MEQARIAGRNTQGVRVFKTDAEEKVVSVERIPDDGSTDEAGSSNGEVETPDGSG